MRWFCFAATIVQQAVRDRALCWHLSTFPWMKRFNNLELEQTLQEFITATVSHYRSQCYAWDVVNEALTDDGKLRPTLRSRIEAFESAEFSVQSDD